MFDSLAEPVADPPEELRRPVAQIYFQIPDTSTAGVPIDIGGMSGGPVLTATRSDSGIRFRLLAVQNRWMKQSRIAAATRADQLGLSLKEVILQHRSGIATDAA